MAVVYWEYLAKASRFIEQRGDSLFSQGSQANAVTRMWENHGAWPLGAFAGTTNSKDPRHDHQRMYREMNQLLQMLQSKNMWDEPSARAMIQVILDRHLGRPPESFEHAGKKLSPKAFMKEVTRIEPADYVGLISTLSLPFHARGKLDVPDNWWKDDRYYNVPLSELFTAIKKAIAGGYSMVLAIDVSEPGKDAERDVMFVPDYDIPPQRIDQLAREYRFTNRATTDDHGVHLVGHSKHAGHDWFLIKDSGRSARRGKHKGYYFVRDDYIQLKVMAVTVHRDAVADLLKRFRN